MGKHTPGPWKWDEPSNWRGTAARVCNDNYDPIAQVQIGGWPRSKALANTRLIAAAPEMYEVLKLIAESEHKYPAALWDKIKAALAKADGEGKS